VQYVWIISGKKLVRILDGGRFEQLMTAYWYHAILQQAGMAGFGGLFVLAVSGCLAIWGDAHLRPDCPTAPRLPGRIPILWNGGRA
jgi:hypothetical protein